MMHTPASPMRAAHQEQRMSTFSVRSLRLTGWLLLGVLGSAHAQQYADPPDRVARLSDSTGDVSYSPAGEDDWLRALRNRPLIAGDRLWTDRRARAELQFGTAALRLDQYTSMTLLNLDDRIAQVEVTQGVVNLGVRRVYDGQEFEIATPTLAFVADQRGSYRIEVDADAGTTTVIVWAGDAMAYGDRANFPLREGDAVVFYDASLRDYEFFDMPRLDTFDRYAQSRDDRLERSASLRYVSDDLIGYADLDTYGSWSTTSTYGAVWYPRDVGPDWAPYRDGHWAWQEPWGWTWIDDAPWGFAPSHYGRWAWVNNRWGWLPGPRNRRPVYAPALVAFVGGRNWSVSVGSSPIGWFPLGPRDVYVPSYRASRDYFDRVNLSNAAIDRGSFGNVYAGYASGRPDLSRLRYANRGVAGAITAVPGSVFTGARPVRQSILQLDRDSTARSELMHIARMSPSRSSVIGGVPQANVKPGREVFDRGVIARTAPQAPVQPFAARREALQRNPGDAQPLPARPQGGRARPSDEVRVIGTPANAVNTREAVAPRGGDAARPEPQRSVRQQQLDEARRVQQQRDAGGIGVDAGRDAVRAREEQRRNDAQQRQDEARRQDDQRRQREAADQRAAEDAGKEDARRRERVEMQQRQDQQQAQQQQLQQQQNERERQRVQIENARAEQQQRENERQAQQAQREAERQALQQQREAERAQAVEQQRAANEARQAERERQQEERNERQQEERKAREQEARDDEASDEQRGGRARRGDDREER
jgi:hypothetical protein